MTVQKPHILIVDDEAENLRALERTLRSEYEIAVAGSPDEALKLASQTEFALVISDQRMPGMSGAELLSRISKQSPHTTRIILTGFTDTKEMLDSINRAEIYRYITKPWDNQELLLTVRQGVERFDLLRANRRLIKELTEKNSELVSLNQNLEKLVEQRTQELRAANERLNEQAMTDPLTKIFNRRAIATKFAEELERSKRYKHQITVAMIDVDHFKEFNDMEGHLFGDEALRKIAAQLVSQLRKTDLLSRYGGEEFLLVMPETPVDIGAEICDRLRASIEQTVFQGQKDNAYITISIGVSGYPKDGKTAEELIHAADKALYDAKAEGRNRVVKN